MAIRELIFWCGVYWLCGHIRTAAQWVQEAGPAALRKWRRSRTAIKEDRPTYLEEIQRSPFKTE